LDRCALRRDATVTAQLGGFPLALLLFGVFLDERRRFGDG